MMGRPNGCRLVLPSWRGVVKGWRGGERGVVGGGLEPMQTRQGWALNLCHCMNHGAFCQ